MEKIQNLISWSLLVECSKTRLLSQAASNLGIFPSEASKILASLESELGIPLVNRSKKPMVFSPELFTLAKEASAILRAQSKCLSLAHQLGSQKIDEGQKKCIKLCRPSNMEFTTLLHAISRYALENPSLIIENYSERGICDLLAKRVDILICPFKPQESRLEAIYLNSNRTFCMAEKSYLKSNGVPQTINELPSHTLISRNLSDPCRTEYLENMGEKFFLSQCPKKLYGDGITARLLLLSGQGIATDIDASTVSEELLNGKVIPVLPEWHRCPWENYLCCRKEDLEDADLSAFVEFLRKNFYKSFVNDWKFWYRKFGIFSEEAPRL